MLKFAGPLIARPPEGYEYFIENGHYELHATSAKTYSKSKRVSAIITGTQVNSSKSGIGALLVITTPKRQTAINTADSLVGTTNPFWKDEVRNGQGATTAASGSRLNYRVGYITGMYEQEFKGASQFDYQYRKDEIFGYPGRLSIPTYVTPSLLVTQAVESRVIRQFIQRSDEARSSFESGQDFGEIRQSVGSIIRPLASLRAHVLSYFPQVKKLGQKHKGVALHKALADTYLEWTFGWNPLAKDVADAYAGAILNDHFDSVPISASAHEDFDAVFTNHVDDAFLTPTGSLAIRVNRTKICTYSVRLQGSVRTGAVNGQIPLTQRYQLTPEYFLPTAWDLLPYSFIVDYFTNVGDCVRSFCYRFANVAWANKTIRQIVRETYKYECYPNGLSTDFKKLSSQFGGSNSDTNLTQFTRSKVVPDDLVARLNFHIPTSSKPWENIGALLLSRARPISKLLQSVW